ncbi:type IV toxin-antitoxin system AbiEi family antitoxin domain-containing protein [uncultured Aquabacterium sp.]
MAGNQRHSLLKRLQSDMPRGAPFGLAELERLGISPTLAAHYVESGWLLRLAQGVYAFPGDDVNVHGSIKLLQSRVTGLHVGGKTALALQGVRHNLSTREQWVLWGDVRFAVPDWFTSRFPARYASARLFEWADEGLPKKSLITPPGLPLGLLVSAPERALLEMLYDVGTRQSLEEARNLFDGVRNLRKDMLGHLLACCTSVKTVRLFLAWSRETGLVDVEEFLQRYTLPVGSDKRWMSRMKDGSLLTLKPHG